MSRPIKQKPSETHLSGYQLMWMIVMFDLPVDTKENNRAASKFREFLLDEGFEMSQFSVYARFCNGKEKFDTYVRRVGRNLPPRGEIHILQFTDRQYETIIRFSAQSRKKQRKNPDQLALF
jgi:CRISPR-associated protein Cas2